MRLRNPSEVETFLKAVRHDGPAFVLVAHSGGTPTHRKLFGVGASFGAEATGYVAVDDHEAVIAFVSGLMLRPLVTYDAADTTEQFAIFFGVVPPLLADVVTAQNLLRNRVRLEFLHHWSFNAHASMTHEERARLLEIELPDKLGKVLDHEATLSEYGMRVVYEIELRAAMTLAHSAAQGYRKHDERVYPTWHTLHESGSGNITAVAPPLVSTKALDRVAYIADDGHRWVQIEWPHLDIESLAGLSGDPWLTDLAREPDPYHGLMELWSVPRIEAEHLLKTVISIGPDLVAWRAKGGADKTLLDLMACCPDWVHWAAERKKQAEADGCLPAYMGRLVKVDAARKAHAIDVQTAQSMLLKMLIARLPVEAELNPQVFAGLRSLIPVYSKLAYQIDVHVPLSRHVPAAIRAGSLRVNAVPLRVAVSMGPSWGQLTPATSSVMSQAEQDLLSPASYFFLCPLCARTTQDEATLRQHAVDEHHLDPADAANVNEFVERSKTEASRAED